MLGGTTPNQPPAANCTYSCTAARLCTFNGSSASDPDGQVVSWTWTNANGKVLSTATTFSRQLKGAATVDITLTVVDNGGLSNARAQAVVIP